VSGTPGVVWIGYAGQHRRACLLNVTQ
jgi:hypothetical protein